MTDQNIAAQAAGKILTYLGFAQAMSMEPGVDRRRDHIQSLIESTLLSQLRAEGVQAGEPVADERCKRCGGPGWYTSHTTGYPESIPCSACNPQGVSVEQLAKDPFLAAQLWRKSADAEGSPLERILEHVSEYGESMVSSTLLSVRSIARRNVETRIAAELAALASAPVAAERQYHYRMPNCTPGRPQCREGNGYPECPCWHDMGTGPLKGKEASATHWRNKPITPVPKDASVVWKHTHRISGVIELSMEDLEENPFNREKWESVPHYAAPQASEAVPLADCYSNNDGDSWLDCPDDIEFVHGLKVGDEYELKASIWAWPERFRVTKVPDDTSDDYEVEPVSICAMTTQADKDGCANG